MKALTFFSLLVCSYSLTCCNIATDHQDNRQNNKHNNHKNNKQNKKCKSSCKCDNCNCNSEDSCRCKNNGPCD